MGQAVVTSRTLYGEFQTTLTLHRLIEGIKVTKTPFRAVLRAEHEEIKALELAETIIGECYFDIGKAVPVLAEVESSHEEIKQAAVKVGHAHIKKDESFCLRIHKRGVHSLEKPTPELEYEVGGAVHDALAEKHKIKPKVDLSNPEVTVLVEVLGKESVVGIIRKEWQS
ncbi:MAG: THUMP domain-containing protein [Candidatus Hydrothermarchaeota archaeon]|nr:THUMP domain-containing protein [Candidatus Hydrothermarchaeota archaeon]